MPLQEKEDYDCAMNLKTISRSRVILSQVIACVAMFLVLTSIGMSFSLVTIALPSLLNAKEGMSMNKYQASWFGSLAYLAQPMGSIFSGALMDYFGRRKAQVLVNLPHFVAWLLFTFSWNLPSVFVANALLGIGSGLMAAPSVTYVTEISEPKIRGILTTISTAFVSVGAFGTYLIGSVLPWKTATACFLAVPIITSLMVLFVPETPVWLLSRGRKEEALKSLCWVRGWCSAENVQQEFEELVNYHKINIQNVFLQSNDLEMVYTQSKPPILRKFVQKIKCTLLVKETLRPFALTLVYFASNYLSGIGPLKPNLINVCKAFGMIWDGKIVVVFVGLLLIITNVSASLIIKLLGKRGLSLLAMSTVVLSSSGLGIYALFNLKNVYSYDPETFPAEKSWLPTVLFFMLVIGYALALPWIIISEVFPFKSRGLASGMVAAGCYVVGFISTKSYLDFETYLGISGAFFMNAIFAFLGLMYLYTFLPETENKTLQEIETHFRGDDQIIDSCLKRLFMDKRDTPKCYVYEKVELGSQSKESM